MIKDYQVTSILIRLLERPDRCPHFTQTHLFSTIQHYAAINKVDYLLLHFIDCRQCRKYLTPIQKKTIHHLRQKLLHHTLIVTENISKIESLLQLHPQTISWYKLITYTHRGFVIGTDLDFWIHPAYISPLIGQLLIRKYIFKAWYLHEITLTAPKSYLNIDLHNLIGFPRQINHDLFSPKFINQLSQTIITQYRQQSSIQTLTPYHQLIVLITQYAATDLLKGLRNLYSIGDYYQHHYQNFDWIAFNKLTQHFHFLPLANFCLILSSKLYQFPLPSHLYTQSQSFRYRILLYFHQPQYLAKFTPADLCRTTPHPITQRLERELSITAQLADLDIPWTSLIKPRIISFCLTAFMRQLISPVITKLAGYDHP